METGPVIFVTIISLISLFLFFWLGKFLLGVYRRRSHSRGTESTQVGFVVETFHELVAKLKEKERELEALRKSAENKALDIELYNENIFQSVPSGIVSFDDELKVTKVNAAAEEILALKEDEVMGTTYGEVFGSPVAALIGKRETVRRAEVSYVTGGGKRMWLGLTLSPLRDSAGSTIGQLLIFTDLTDLKALESQAEIRERLSNLGEMAAGIAHELRNPLAVISGYTKILSRKADDSLRPPVEMIAKEIAVMDRIITDFLSFARPAHLVLAEVSLAEILESCVRAMGEGRAKVKVNAPQSPIIRADEVLMRQALGNLLRNAVESMPGDGEIAMDVSVGEGLVIRISDRGHGIQEDLMEKIFLPFYTTKEGGTGLGLSIVHKIVISHGGTIRVESGTSGTTFTITLPREMIVS